MGDSTNVMGVTIHAVDREILIMDYRARIIDCSKRNKNRKRGSKITANFGMFIIFKN